MRSQVLAASQGDSAQGTALQPPHALSRESVRAPRPVTSNRLLRMLLLPLLTLPWLRLRLSVLPRTPLLASACRRMLSWRPPVSFQTSRKASPMFLLAAPPCSATCAGGGGRGGRGLLSAC